MTAFADVPKDRHVWELSLEFRPRFAAELLAVEGVNGTLIPDGPMIVGFCRRCGLVQDASAFLYVSKYERRYCPLQLPSLCARGMGVPNWARGVELGNRDRAEELEAQRERIESWD